MAQENKNQSIPVSIIPTNIDDHKKTAIAEGLKDLGINAPTYLAVQDSAGCIIEYIYCATFDDACNIIYEKAPKFKVLVLANTLNKSVLAEFGSANTGLFQEPSEHLIEKVCKLSIDIKKSAPLAGEIDDKIPEIMKIVEVLCSNYCFPHPSFLNYGDGCKLIFETEFSVGNDVEELFREFVSVFEEKFEHTELTFFNDFDCSVQFMEIPGTPVLGGDTTRTVLLQKSTEEALITHTLIENFINLVQNESLSYYKNYMRTTKGKFDASSWIFHRLKCLNSYINPTDNLVYSDMTNIKTKQYLPICISDQGFLDCLADEIYANYKHMLNTKERKIIAKAVSQAVNKAYFIGRRDAIHCRSVKIGDTLFYDLHRNDGLVYAVNPDQHFSFTKDNLYHRHLHFTSTSSMMEQVRPSSSTNHSLPQLLDPFLNMNENSKILLIITILCWFVKGSNYFLWLNGLNGSGKTLLTSFINKIVDPTSANPGTLPTSVRELAVTLSAGYLAVFDNITKISDDVSDLLCQAAYGGTYTTRKLYTNKETTCVRFHNVIILNSISEEVVKKPDLLQRIIPIKLNTITDGRKSEQKLKVEFKLALPAILYGIFDTLRKAFKILPETKSPSNFRFIDAARLGCAISKILWDDENVFINAFNANMVQGSFDLLENDALTNIVLSWLREQESMQLKKGFSHPLTLPPIKATTFHETIVNFAKQNNINITTKGLAPDATAFTKKLNTYSINFNNIGVEFSRIHTNSGNIVNITIKQSINPVSNPLFKVAA